VPDLPDRLAEALKDRYTLQRELGRGGMATVYLATDRKHERPVALKVLKPELAAVLGADRFLREIKTTAQLTHPHILPLLDSGEADGTLYYVMPYVEGESLRDRLIREKQLPVDDALQISREVADALSYAHAHGVIHRDIKPENILLESGHAVVADFGIARAVDQAGGDRLTGTGVALGTPAYMSPEQAAGSKDLDGRSDLYALGCVLYEMLAGQPPFTGPTVESLVHQHLAAEPPHITGIRPAVPAQVAATLERALAKTPADRFNPVALFAEALGPRGSIATMSQPEARAARRWSWERLALIGTSAVIVIAATIIVGRRTTSPPAAPAAATSTRTAIAVLPFQNLTADEARAFFASGLHDELLTQLAKVGALKVISRTSVLGYAGTTKSLREIADELGVGSIVEGSVQADGNRLRVNVQLIDAAGDEHLWAERYDRTLDDMFAVQSEIAQQIVAAVGATLAGTERTALAAAPTANAEAYRLYLQGLEYWRRPGGLRQNFEIAQELYQRALALDSTFALAYAALSQVHGFMSWYRYDPSPERFVRQREAAETALRLAPHLPQAHVAMGRVYYSGRRDWRGALREYQVALEGLPNDAELWLWMGYAHRRLGNWAEALAARDKVVALDPRNAEAMWEIGGGTAQALHRYEEAVTWYSRALQVAPDLAGADIRRGGVWLYWHGRLDSLATALDRYPPETALGSGGSIAAQRALVLLYARRPDSLLALLRRTPSAVFENQLGYLPVALYAGWAYRLRGEPALARAMFDSARVLLDSVTTELPDDWRVHAARGLTLAGLGRRQEARREAQWLERSPIYQDDAFEGRPVLGEARAQILAAIGDGDAALREIERLLSGPSWVSVHTLRLDPCWDPIRTDPRFQALLEKYDPPQPVLLH
jgi:serine/threonine protein kinase/tetratricopeptide (TPR) repeat protein